MDDITKNSHNINTSCVISESNDTCDAYTVISIQNNKLQLNITQILHKGFYKGDLSIMQDGYVTCISEANQHECGKL